MKSIINSFIIIGTVMMDATVLKNKALLPGPGSCPSCSDNIGTVAAVGKHPPSTTIHLIIGAIGRKYTIARVISGMIKSFPMLVSIITRLFIISLKLYAVRVEPMKIMAIGVEMFPM